MKLRHAAIDITVLYYAIVLMNIFVDNKSVENKRNCHTCT